MVSRPIALSPALSTDDDDVPLSFARALLVQARAFGKNIDAILMAANFPFNPLEQELPSDTVIAVEQYSRLCMELFESLGDEAGGIIQGMPTPVGATRMLAYSIIHCQNLREAMERSIEFNAVCRERSGSVKVHDLELSDDGKWVTLNYFSHAEADNSAQDGVLCSMAIWLRVCSWLIGKDIEVSAAGCASPVPENRSGLQHFLLCPLAFEQSCNWLRFSASHLDKPIIRSEDDLEAFLKVAPYHVVIKPVVNEQSVADRIRSIMGEDLREELPTFEQLTKQLNMSARTLRRRLDKEGTSYRRIKDGARRDAAIEYLNDAQLTVSDVAELVGFSDPSAFHRSFKRWTGLSPGEYR
jgi:AraC-like DNA-binding protein